MGGRGIVLVGLLGTPGTARGGGVSESIAKAPRRANGTRGLWCRSSRTTPDAETCTSPSSVQFQPSFSSAKYTSRRRGGPTTAAVNRGDDRPGASPVIRREGLTVYYASSPSATPPFLVQWRVKERSRWKRAQQTWPGRRAGRWRTREISRGCEEGCSGGRGTGDGRQGTNTGLRRRHDDEPAHPAAAPSSPSRRWMGEEPETRSQRFICRPRSRSASSDVEAIFSRFLESASSESMVRAPEAVNSR